MPVPLFEAGSFVAGLEEWGAFVADEEGVKLYSWTPVRSRGDRELGGIAQYELRFSFPHGAVAALDEDQLSRLTEVTQVVVLLSDADAAARWLMTKTRRLEDLEGQEVDGHLYGKVDVDITLTGLGDEAAVVVAHTEVGRAGTPSCETYINFRAGRLFGSVGASTYKELEVRPQLRELAEAFLSRMESILAGRPVTVRPVARSSGKRPGRSSSPARPTHGHGRDAQRARRPRAASGRHEIIGGVAGLAIWFGWPSAVVVFFAHRWGSLFTSDAAVDAGRAIVLVFAGFGAFVFAVMGLGPWMEAERISVSSLLGLLAIAFGPTIVLALFFYGHV